MRFTHRHVWQVCEVFGSVQQVQDMWGAKRVWRPRLWSVSCSASACVQTVQRRKTQRQTTAKPKTQQRITIWSQLVSRWRAAAYHPFTCFFYFLAQLPVCHCVPPNDILQKDETVETVTSVRLRKYFPEVAFQLDPNWLFFPELFRYEKKNHKNLVQKKQTNNPKNFPTLLMLRSVCQFK